MDSSSVGFSDLFCNLLKLSSEKSNILLLQKVYSIS